VPDVTLTASSGPVRRSAVAAFDILRYHYANPLAAAHELQHPVGIIGNTVPRELVMAAGCCPVLLTPEPGRPTPAADAYMESIIPPETRALAELALTGAFEFIDLLVLSRPYSQLYYYLKELYRLGRATSLPPLHMVDLMQSQREAVRAYNWSRIQDFVAHLEHQFGIELTDSRLRLAITLTNQVRALQRQLLDLRWTGAVRGTDALQALGAGYLMPVEPYIVALAAYIDGLQAEPSLAGRARLLLVPSEPLAYLHLHQTLEDAGALVIAEDDWWGSRAPESDVPLTGSALEGLFLKYWLDTPTASVNPSEKREAWLTTHALRDEVDCVVFHLPPSDHQLGWDYPRLKAWLEAHDKPSLLIRHDATTADGQTSISEQIRAWLATRP
jgi:benzoyl-CoA reductase/2-hydroxyglutaryl-CoA dehydratase subunit BcrC/BadD/HgdB